MLDIEKLIKDYEPNEQAIELVRSTKVVLLAGITGAGKDTIKKRLLKIPYFRDIVSHTTRLPRINNGKAEEDGVDYHFIDQPTAMEMLQKREFVEAKFVHGTIYGTSVAEIKLAYDQNKVAITDIDVQGVAEYEKLSPCGIAIFIVPPTYQTWIERLKKRYKTEADFQAEWPKRRQSSIEELKHALEVPYYHVIINDDLDDAVQICHEIIERGDIFSSRDDHARLAARSLLDELEKIH
ncbi:MAG: hypothetical protein HXL06_003535 [Candidatus Nanosynbacter sp. HMT-348_TM7c-JB]|jgi:guanylate kinase|nr:MAG: hypothetical protein HXL06_003535 [Candidatus Nanosynbacter sp. HMT-348_TM7c-JB]